MRDTGIVNPFLLEVSPNSINNEGGRIMSSDVELDYEVRVSRVGEDLNAASQDLGVRIISGQPGGNFSLRKSPPTHGYMPDTLFEPFEVAISDTASPSLNDWYGNANLFVRDFFDMPFNIQGDSSTYRSVSFQNSRMFSYDGDLYFLTESKARFRNKIAFFANLFKWDSDNNEFGLVKRFDRFPTTPQLDATNQTGSPDWTIHNGEVYVAYKFNDVENSVHRLIVMKAVNDSLTEWNLVSDTEIENVVADSFDKFRLRMASGGGAISIVIYMAADIEEQPGYTVEKHDMRSFASYDSGRTFKTLSTSFSNVIDSGGEYASTRSVTNMADLFISEFSADSDASDYNNFKVTFDLYYDKNMASFVILKPADRLKSSIIGVKTIDDSFLRWEPVVNYDLNYLRTVTRENTAIDGDQYDLSGLADDDNQYVITDLCVIPSEEKNYVIYTATRFPDDYGLTNYRGVGIAEFSFVSSDRIPPGLYDRVFAYGGKYHQEYCFISGPWNFDHGSFASTGNPTEFQFDDVAQPVGCIWRNQVVTSCKVDKGVNSSGTIVDEFSCFSVMAPYQNYEEKHGYQFAYCKSLGDLDAWDMAPTASSGVINYNTTTKWNDFTIGAGGHAYYDITEDASVNTQNVMERASLSPPFFWKVKWQMGITNATNTVKFLRVAAGSTTGMTAELTANADGSFVLQDFTGATLHTTSSLVDWSGGKKWEFILGTTYNRSKANTTWLLYREVGTKQWTIGFQANNSAQACSPTFRIGILSGDENNEVHIGDIQISALDGYFPMTGLGKFEHPSNIEGGGYYTATPANYDDPHWSPSIKVFGDSFEYKDGAVIQILGTGVLPDQGNSWSYGKSKTRNDAGNLIDGVADFAYEFGNSYNHPVGEPYCHCYSDNSPLTGGQHTDEGELVVFNNLNRHKFDSVSLININGVHCFQLIFGTYDEGTDTWDGSEDVIQYSVPRVELDVQSAVGNKILVADEFDPQQLVGHDVLVYDVLNDNYDEQLQVVKNFDQFIEFSSAVPSLTNKELHLMHNSHTFEVPSPQSITEYTNVGIRFFSPPTANLLSVGQLALGKFVRLEDYVTGISVSERSYEDVVESEYGFLLPNKLDSNVIEVFDISMDQVRDRDLDIVWSLLIDSYRKGSSYPLVVQDDEGNNVTHYGVMEPPAITPSENGQNISVAMWMQNYKPKSRSLVVNEPPIVRAIIRPTDVEVGDSVSFSSVATDPEGESLTYLWDFGDGTTSTSMSPSHSYSEVGEYKVTLTVTDASGASTIRVGKVTVAPYTGDRLLIGLTNPEPLATGVTEEVTVSILATDNTIVTGDSSTKIRAIPFGDIEVDMNQDGTFGATDDDDYYSVTNGQFTLDIRSATAGDYNLMIVSSDGLAAQIEITFA